MSGREKLLEREALTINFVTSKLWQAKRGSVLHEGAEGVSERLFYWSQKQIKEDKQKRRSICTTSTAVTAAVHVLLLPGHSRTVHSFHSFCLLHLSLEACGLDVVSLIFLTSPGPKRQGIFQEDLFSFHFLSVKRDVYESSVNESFHLPL